jgi:hypothetical protein
MRKNKAFAYMQTIEIPEQPRTFSPDELRANSRLFSDEDYTRTPRSLYGEEALVTTTPGQWRGHDLQPLATSEPSLAVKEAMATDIARRVKRLDMRVTPVGEAALNARTNNGKRRVPPAAHTIGRRLERTGTLFSHQVEKIEQPGYHGRPLKAMGRKAIDAVVAAASAEPKAVEETPPQAETDPQVSHDKLAFAGLRAAIKPAARFRRFIKNTSAYLGLDATPRHEEHEETVSQ